MEQPPFIARRVELQVLVERFDDALRLRRGGTVVVHGDEGAGASRLAAQLGDELSRRGIEHRLLAGRCSRSAPIAYGALVGVLRDLPGAADGWLAEAAAVAAWNPDHAATTLLAGAARRLVEAARDQPMLVVFDEFDAADASTKRLVDGLGSLIADQRILLVCAGRSAADGRPPATGTVSPPAVAVPAMTNDELGELFDALDGTEKASRAQVVHLAAGRPDMLLALARAARLDEGLMMLLATIAPHADRAVAVASLAAGWLSTAALAELTDCTPDQLAQLVRAGALHDTDDGTLSATGPWANAARHGLGASWPALAAQVAAVLPTTAPSALRAAAWEAAGNAVAAAAEHERAAHEAYQRHGIATAAEALRRAIELGGSDVLLRSGRLAAEWSLSAGDRVETRNLADTLLPLLPRADVETLVALHVLRHHALFELDDPGADAALDAALALGGTSVASTNALEVDVHRLLQRDVDAAQRRAVDAVQSALACGAAESIAAALGVQALVEGFAGRFDQSLDLFGQAMLQAEAAGAIAVESRVASNRLYVLWLAGRPTDLEREAALELARRLSRGLASVADHVASMRGIALAQLGRLAEARTVLQEAIALNGAAAVRATAELTIASLDIVEGRVTEARRAVRSVAGRGVAGLQEVATEVVLCNYALAAAEGRWTAAAALAAGGHVVAAGHEVSQARMLLAETRAATLAGLPLPTPDQRPAFGRELSAIAAERAALQSGGASDHNAAVEAWLQLPAPIEAWRCRFVAAARNQDLAALELLTEDAERLGAAGLAGQAGAAWRNAGGRRAPRRAGGELTDREVDVLQLVAEGLTNKEIAARLHLSPRTVGVHLEHCFTKLVVGTRGAAVQEAMRRGIVRPPA